MRWRHSRSMPESSPLMRSPGSRDLICSPSSRRSDQTKFIRCRTPLVTGEHLPHRPVTQHKNRLWIMFPTREYCPQGEPPLLFLRPHDGYAARRDATEHVSEGSTGAAQTSRDLRAWTKACVRNETDSRAQRLSGFARGLADKPPG
jgi:hypothetical protein